MTDAEWVEKRMETLAPSSGFSPDAGRGLARLQDRDRRYLRVKRNWVWMAATATVACVVLIALPSKSICCSRPTEAPPAPAVKPATVNAPAAFKQSGSPTAPLVCEIYADFECPACAAFYRDTYPRLVSNYVKTGKVRMIHRDFPLPMHPFAKLAARYANAAGEEGDYELVFDRLFATQPDWAANGNIEAAIAPVLSREAMVRIHQLATEAPRSADSTATDVKSGMADQLTQTPTVVVVWKGVRTKIPGAVSYSVLSAYLDELLIKQ